YMCSWPSGQIRQNPAGCSAQPRSSAEVRQDTPAYVPPSYMSSKQVMERLDQVRQNPKASSSETKPHMPATQAAQVMEKLDQIRQNPQGSSAQPPSSAEVREDLSPVMRSKQGALGLKKNLEDSSPALPSSAQPQSVEKQWAARLLGVGVTSPASRQAPSRTLKQPAE